MDKDWQLVSHDLTAFKKMRIILVYERNEDLHLLLD